MHLMFELVTALDLPYLLEVAAAMDERDAYYGQALGNYWPEMDEDDAGTAHLQNLYGAYGGEDSCVDGGEG